MVLPRLQTLQKNACAESVPLLLGSLIRGTRDKLDRVLFPLHGVVLKAGFPHGSRSSKDGRETSSFSFSRMQRHGLASTTLCYTTAAAYFAERFKTKACWELKSLSEEDIILRLAGDMLFQELALVNCVV